MEGFVDSSDSYVNVMIITHGRYRITTFKQTIERYNANKLSDSSKVIIRAQSQFDDEIMSLSRLEGAKRDKHGFYRRILEAKIQKNPSYFQWSSNDEQKKNRNEFEVFSAMIDDIKDNSPMTVGQYLGTWEHNGPTAQQECTIVQETHLHADIQKLASRKHPLLVDQLFDPEILRQIEEWDQAEQRLKDAEEDDEFEPGHEGTVYWAETPFLPGLLKNGGSRYDGATRVRQLFTAGVPLPYVLRHEKTFNDWKLYEGVIHEYFKAARVYERKEFFSCSLEDAIKLTNQIDGLEAFSDDEKMRWDRAMLKISKRLSKNRAAWARKKAKTLSKTPPDESIKALTDETLYLKQELEKYRALLQSLTSDRDQT